MKSTLIMNWLASFFNRRKKSVASDEKLPDIPAEIIFDILSNLPLKSLCRFKLVSKSWQVLINYFVKARLENKPRKQKLIIASNNYPYSFYTLTQSPDEHIEFENFSKSCLEIIGSFNGVLLLCRMYANNSGTLYFWNPFTQHHHLIPKPCNFLHCVIKGLAYDSTKNDFQVVMAITDRLHNDKFYNVRAYVFSSVSSSWKRIGYFGYHYSSVPGVVINGSPHWIVGHLQGPNVIVYFDPQNEKFRELPVPIIETCASNLKLAVLGGDLCGIKDNHANNSVDVWILKGSIWSKFFVLPLRKGELSARVLTPLCFVGKEDDFNGEFVVFQLDTHALALYNRKKRRFEKRIELPRNCKKFSAACYVETLACP